MVKNKKKWIIIATMFLLIVIVASVVNYYSSRVYWKYDDKWIIGRTKEEIIERYGAFDEDFFRERYFIYKDRGLFGGGYDTYYYIIFDEANYAIEVYIGGHPGG